MDARARRGPALRDPLTRADKLARVSTTPVADLNRLVARWRRDRPDRTIPWFDPDDGGSSAAVLVLMESPGPRTVAAGPDGFCSEDNDDPTAATLAAVRTDAGLDRSDYVRWNIVPWPVTGPDGRWGAPRESDLVEATPYLAAVVGALPRLQIVVCMGAKALSGYMRYVTVTPGAPVLPVLGVPHPSQRNTRARAEALARMHVALARAAQLAQATTQAASPASSSRAAAARTVSSA